MTETNGEKTLAFITETNPDVNSEAGAWAALWASDPGEAADAVGRLYAPLAGEPADPAEAAAEFAREFSLRLKRDCPQIPLETDTQRHALVTLAGSILRRERTVTPPQFRHLRYLAALRPVRRLSAGELTPEICAGLYDYHRGVWEGRLSRYELYCVRVGLAQTLADFPPDGIGLFWKTLREGDPMHRHAMLHGFAFFRSAHAVPHLLEGFRTSPEHNVRAAIVNCLEQIGVPTALPTLRELKRETAYTDWTLSRHIARAIRVIEMHSKDHAHHQLLRATNAPPSDNRGLLRPASELDADRASLLRTLPRNDEHEDKKD